MAWNAAANLPRDAFRQKFLEPFSSDTTVDLLRGAAQTMVAAKTTQELGAAGVALTKGMLEVSLDRWPRFLADADNRASAASSGAASRPYQVAQLDTHTATDGTTAADPAAQLVAAAHAAYPNFKNDCSGFVHAVLIRMGYTDEPSLTANEFMDHVQQPESKWERVSMQEATALAKQGKVVVAGRAESHGSGHIEIVGPDNPRSAGGINGGRIIPGSYPEALSGSASTWPGSRSDGNNTVRDGWSESEFHDVTFWVQK